MTIVCLGPNEGTINGPHGTGEHLTIGHRRSPDHTSRNRKDALCRRKKKLVQFLLSPLARCIGTVVILVHPLHYGLRQFAFLFSHLLMLRVVIGCLDYS